MTLPDSRNTPGSMAEYLTLSLLADSRDIDEDEAGADDITATPAAVAAANLPASASILSLFTLSYYCHCHCCCFDLGSDLTEHLSEVLQQCDQPSRAVEQTERVSLHVENLCSS